MSKNWVMLTGLLFLGFMGTSQAHPLDSPDIVYIDGLPCNGACQSYMAWSRQQTSSIAQRSVPVKPAPTKRVFRSVHSAVHHATAVHRQGSKPAVPRIAKRAVPLPPAEIAKLQPAGNAAVRSEPAPADVAASPAGDGAVHSEPAPANVAASRAGDAAVHSEPAPANFAASPPAGDGTATSKARTVQEQVAAATALAEHVTAASAVPVLQQNANNAEASLHSEAVHPSDTEPTKPAATSDPDNLVAILMARPEIKSVPDLSGRDVAIEDQQSASSASIQAAFASTGAAEVQLKEGPVKAIDRLIGGEVPAAVLTLVSPEAAESFPDIPGYSIFRIPLSPGSKRRL